MNRFEQLLYDFNELTNLSLYAEKNTLCKLVINEALRVHLEFDEAKERLLIASQITDVPPGKFREELLKEALKANNIFPRQGTLCFSEKSNKLSLFDYYPMSSLNAQKFSDLLTTFIERAELWKNAVEKGNMSSISQPPPRPVSAPPFGIKR